MAADASNSNPNLLLSHKLPETTCTYPERDVAIFEKYASEEEMRRLRDVVRSLPSIAVKDLLCNGVCMRCIFRLFGIHGDFCFSSSLSPSLILMILEEPKCSEEHIVGSDLKGDGNAGNPSISNELQMEPELCQICLGILQFTYHNGKEMLVKQQSAYNLAESIAELVKHEGHQIDKFSLEVSVPAIILENEQAVWLYLKRKYGLELWFSGRLTEFISTKDALKFALENPLETLLNAKSGPSAYRIRLTFTQTKQPSNKSSDSVERNGGCKKRKIGNVNGLDTANVELVNATAECFDVSVGKANALSEVSFDGMEDNEPSKCSIFPAERVNKACHLTFLCYRTPIYFGGRYLKFSRNVSQTRWIIDDERMGEASVEEVIGGNILPICRGDMYKFHAAGREDIDVRMLGSGRPFLVEVQNARQIPSEACVKEIETKINNLENKVVGVNNLKLVDNHGWSLMHEGEAEKQKQYCALVWISRSLEDEDLQSIASVKDLQVLQRTPIRVLHRRSPLEREKIIHWMQIERIAGSDQYFLLHLCTQAGTYIKEFVHGDLGRTHPSIGSILGCRAEILQLDVTEVKMDCFLTE